MAFFNPAGHHSTVILYRYFASQVFLTMFAVAGVVLAVATAWRFSGYLDEAAQGLLTQDILFLIIAYRLPGFLELVIPISFFLSIMLVYGRLWADSEMVVLQACGFSDRRLLITTLVLAFLVMLLTAFVTLYLKPMGDAKVEDLFNEQRSMTEFDTLVPGRFQTLRTGKRVTYTEELTDEGELDTVFISEFRSTGFQKPKEVVTVIAESGHSARDENGDRFLVLRNGKRFSGTPGRGDYQVVEYEEYGQLIERERNLEPHYRRGAIPTLTLAQSPNPILIAELQWRLSLVVIVPIIALVAVPLSKVNPRQGRYTRLAPGMLFCILYIVSLSAARSAVEKEQLPIGTGMLTIHTIFFVVMVGFFHLDKLGRPFGALISMFRRKSYAPA
ncbi:MAG: LPS export ABC transporter permease LptF [Gammaproteobacteria bacterium TMED50]|nr:MAG: LPS export ABC transporter permease LptF [Gammaproteobacteria bacterium TMED50]